MKKLIVLFLSGLFLLTGLSLFNNAQAEEKKILYKWVDKDGSIHFSDEPHPGAQEIQVKEAPTIKMKKPTFEGVDMEQKYENYREDAHFDDYQILTLSEPLDGGVVRNNAAVITLTAKIVPELSSDHTIRFFIDGKPVEPTAKSLSVTVENAEYGEHTANFVVLNAEGKQVQASKTHHFNLLHILNKKNRKN